MIRTVITPPAEEPLSLDAAKDFLQVGHDAENDLILSLLAGGRTHIENALDLALVEQEVEVRVPARAVGSDGYELKPGPVRSLVSVLQQRTDGVQEVVTSLFHLDGPSICVNAGESLAALSGDTVLTIRFRAGFGAPADIPEDLQLALRLIVGQSYRNRDGVFDVDAMVTVTDLLAPYREVRL